MATDAQIAHSRRKINNARGTSEQVSKEEENLIRELDSLRKELEKVKKSADAAQGEFIAS